MSAIDAVHDRFPVCLEVVIRPCRETDLPALEWFGLFARGLIRSVFEQHQRGEALMLVAEVGGEASGQLWIDLQRRRAEGAGELWAVRVLPCLQGQGIATRLVAAAEQALRARGFRAAALTVEIDNPRARRLYERLGYVLDGTRLAGDPPDVPEQDRRPQWNLIKQLGAATPPPPSLGPSASAGPWGT